MPTRRDSRELPAWEHLWVTNLDLHKAKCHARWANPRDSLVLWVNHRASLVPWDNLKDSHAQWDNPKDSLVLWARLLAVSQDLWEYLLAVPPAVSDPAVSPPTWDAQPVCLPVVPDQVALLLTAVLETSLETTLFRDSSE